MSSSPAAPSPTGAPPPSPGGLPRASQPPPIVLSSGVNSIVRWILIGIAIISVVVVIRWTFFGEDKKEETANQQSQSTAGAEAQASKPSVKPIEITPPGIICPSAGMAKQTCSFDHRPTSGFGSEVGGKHLRFCFDKPYGASESYQLQQWSSAERKFVDSGTSYDPNDVIKNMRFVGTVPNETVTVTYWLSEGPCA